ncbi:acyl carrier protein [Micromonospora sp. NBC_01699]|uniref:acyl carrier protein n=1 Tax=Micromonospora sp. NBC_01699 TaxID=2975984 RepID=UPI002E2DCC04|nr:acyl carrier protein [Micromonospora sp. NBC_01699]
MDTTNTDPDATVDGGTVEKDLLAFLAAQTRRTWEPDTDLFATGGLSSLFAMQLVVHLETTFGISIRGADLRLDNFRTVDNMVALVRRLGGGSAGE